MGYFGIQKQNKHIVLFNIKGIGNLKTGDIFFRKGQYNTIESIHYLNLDDEYVNSILDKFTQEKIYDYKELWIKN